MFRVALDDGKDHGAGDARPACGFSAGSSIGGLAALLALTLIRRR